jgi:hypothetical protein
LQKTNFRTAVAFSVRLRDETELDTSSGDVVDVVDVVRDAMQPGHVSLWLRTPSNGSAGRGSA